jgi:hypothetical protein
MAKKKAKNQAKNRRRTVDCLRRDCDGNCGNIHKPSQMAVERPDPTGLQAANVRTTGRAITKRARIFPGGLPGLGKH